LVFVATIWRATRSEFWSCITHTSRSGGLARTDPSTLDTSVGLAGNS